MKVGCGSSNSLTEIDSLYISDCTTPGFYKKADVYDYVLLHPGSILVDRYPYPVVRGAISRNGEKYVYSSPNSYAQDNLLSLPRD